MKVGAGEPRESGASDLRVQAWRHLYLTRVALEQQLWKHTSFLFCALSCHAGTTDGFPVTLS
jgi:hypothetical protein